MRHERNFGCGDIQMAVTASRDKGCFKMRKLGSLASPGVSGTTRTSTFVIFC